MFVSVLPKPVRAETEGALSRLLESAVVILKMRVLKQSIQNSKTDPEIPWDPWVLKQLKTIPMTQKEAQRFLKKGPLDPQSTVWVGIHTPATAIMFINSNVTYSEISKNLYVEAPSHAGPPAAKRAKGDPKKISETLRLQIRIDIMSVPQMTVLLSGPEVFIQQMWNRIPEHLVKPQVTTALQ